MIDTSIGFQRLEDVAIIVASEEAPSKQIQPSKPSPGTETDSFETTRAEVFAEEDAAQ